MNKICLRILTPGFAALCSMVAYSQELSLFEEIDNQDNREENQRSRRVSAESSSSLVPEFTLVGTSRIGSDYSVIIKHRNGESIQINSKPNIEIEISGYPSYRLVEVGSGAISIRYPENVECHSNIDLGVSCDEDIHNLARLTLQNASPISSILGDSNGMASSGLNVSEEAAPVNPFEAIRARANNPDSNTDNNNFRPRRIDPDEVPPGMRIVSTPFGDRLVEIDK